MTHLMQYSPMIYIAILALEGVFDSSLSVSLDILSTAKRIHQGFHGGSVSVDVKICGSRKTRITTGSGLNIAADMSIDKLTYADFVIVPGLGVNNTHDLECTLSSEPGVNAIKELKRMRNAGAVLTASCSATFLLAEAGVFEQQVATTSWWLSDVFRLRYPDVLLQTEQLLVTGHGYICAGAAMAQADLMMSLISRIYGEQTAKLTASYLLIDRRQFQSQYIHSGMATQRHPVVAKSESWIRENLAEEFSTKDLAKVMNVSTRTLARRTEEALGVSPIKFIQQIRLEHAIHLLETSNFSFDTIATKVGYKNVSSLRRLLSRTTGKSPKEFRSS